MTIKAFFSIPSVMFAVHVFLVVGVMANVYQMYRIYNIQKDIDREQGVLGLLTQENNDGKNNKDYFTSSLFKEKYAKDNGYKIRGEQVIDTSLIESEQKDANSAYTPEKETQQKPNWQKWYEFFFMPAQEKQ
jgi:hypothetical protein